MRNEMMKSQMSGSKKIRAGDSVVVIAGACKGQSGKVLRCVDDRVLIQGINMCKKHVKRSQQNPKGGVVEMEKPIHVSNVAPCDSEGNALKVQVRVSEGGKELCYRKDGELVVLRSMKRREQ